MMEYASNKLSKMSGVSARTLRYYDEIGLLKPARISSGGYRIYGAKEVDTLQQILLYRELGFALADIKKLLSATDFDAEQAFRNHLASLHAKRGQLDKLIGNVTASLAAMKGEIKMADNKKFEGFKQTLIDENEQKFGTEIRANYGNEAVDASNKKLMGLSQAQYEAVERLSLEVNETLKRAFEQGDPASELAQKACDLHRQWLCYFWQEGMYSKASHKGLADMYVADERFKAYYDQIADGCALFLRDAIYIYCQ